MGRTTEGTTVAEVDLADGGDVPVADLLTAARNRGAALLWVHGGDLRAAGFRPAPGYVRLHADRPVAGEPLDPVEPAAYGALLARAYLGMWGHKHVEPDPPLPADAVALALREDGEHVGLCRLWPDRRLVDGPGLVPGRRTPDRAARLLGAACALLGEGPVEVETWGEAPGTITAYAALGFRVARHDPGWELRL